ncbi:hypothetical protein DXG01_016719 [Tephrocybe rancida]|nr:hypothetical protein DXG01_016719 [Tephrocybe rancida]
MATSNASHAGFSRLTPSHQPEWTLERVKFEVSNGSRINKRVVDIGNGLLIKHGDHIYSREAEATKLVATHTSVPVPRIYATLYDEATSKTYIVQEKLPGRSLSLVLETLHLNERIVIEQELKKIFEQLTSLDSHAPMGMVGKPFQFLGFHPFEYHGPWVATNLLEFIKWPIDKAAAVHGGPVCGPIDESKYDFTKPFIFSHGDLVPENILIHEGHISGIIDWEHAGWYPYFWNAYIGLRNYYRYPRTWIDIVVHIMATYEEDWNAFDELFATAQMYL